MQLAIGEVAKQSGVSVRAIRHYDRHGLLSSKRACNGYRYFPPQAVTQVRQIQRLINIGFSIAEICSFPDCMLMVEGAAFCPETQALQYQRLEDFERQISELESRRTRLMATLTEGIAK